jgi:hypothetical protein
MTPLAEVGNEHDHLLLLPEKTELGFSGFNLPTNKSRLSERTWFHEKWAWTTN